MRNLSALAFFVLGACTAAAAQSVAAPGPPATAPNPGSDSILAVKSPPITPLEARAARVAPNGKAKIAVLAVGENAFVGELTADPGSAVPEHADATEEYIVILEGGGQITIDGTTHTVTAGTTIYMPAGATVSYQNGDQPLRAIQVFAGPEPAAKYDAWVPPK